LIVFNDIHFVIFSVPSILHPVKVITLITNNITFQGIQKPKETHRVMMQKVGFHTVTVLHSMSILWR